MGGFMVNSWHVQSRIASQEAEHGCDRPGHQTPGRLRINYVAGFTQKMKAKGSCGKCKYWGLFPHVDREMRRLYGTDYKPTSEDFMCTLSGWNIPDMCPAHR